MNNCQCSEKAKQLYDVIKSNPGLTSREIGRLMGRSSNQVLTILPSLEAGGLLVSEDDVGRLFPMELSYE